MCHYNYWGYNGCCHEFRHMENRWTTCPLSEHMEPRDCPFAGYTRHKIGINFCESCLDEVPPNHVPVTRLILDLDVLRQAMELSVDQAALNSFIRDYRAGLRRIRETASTSGPNNDFYNEIWALYHTFHQRAIGEMSASWAAFDNASPNIQSASAGIEIASRRLGITFSPTSSSTSPEYYSASRGYGSTMIGTRNTMTSIDSTMMIGVDSTSARTVNISAGNASALARTRNISYSFGTAVPGFNSTSNAV